MQGNLNGITTLINKYEDYFKLDDIDLINPVIIKNLLDIDLDTINLTPDIIKFITNNNFLASPNFARELDTVIKSLSINDDMQALYNVMTSKSSIESKYRSADIASVVVQISKVRAFARSLVIASDIERNKEYTKFLDLVTSVESDEMAMILGNIIYNQGSKYKTTSSLYECLILLSTIEHKPLMNVMISTLNNPIFQQHKYQRSLLSTISVAQNCEMAKFIKSIICSNFGLKNKHLYNDIVLLLQFDDIIEAQIFYSNSLMSRENINEKKAGKIFKKSKVEKFSNK